MRSDNGPQFSSSEFRDFCRRLDIKHVTSSPHFQSSNGAAERAVQTVKRLWRKTADKQLALLNYRTTPLEDVNLSPVQLLMGRRSRNTLPAATDILRPKNQNTDHIKRSLQSVKDKQKSNFDRNHKSKEVLPLYPTDPVRIMPKKVRRPGFQEPWSNTMRLRVLMLFKLVTASCAATASTCVSQPTKPIQKPRNTWMNLKNSPLMTFRLLHRS